IPPARESGLRLALQEVGIDLLASPYGQANVDRWDTFGDEKQTFSTAGIADRARCAIPKLPVESFLPEVQRFDDVGIRIDNLVLGGSRHLVPPLSASGIILVVRFRLDKQDIWSDMSFVA